MALTPEQNVFVLSYATHHNAARAAMDAWGYEEGGQARQAGFNTLRRVKVREAVNKIIRAREKRIADANYVLQKLVNIIELSAQDFTKVDELGVLTYDLEDLTPDQWAAIHSVKYNLDGTIQEIKTHDKLKALEQLGKHVAVNAYRDQVAVTGEGGGAIEYKDTSDVDLDARIKELEAEV